MLKYVADLGVGRYSVSWPPPKHDTISSIAVSIWAQVS